VLVKHVTRGAKSAEKKKKPGGKKIEHGKDLLKCRIERKGGKGKKKKERKKRKKIKK